jgi:hypothetical protein
MAYRDDVDKAMEKRKASVLTSDRHLKVGPEELSRKMAYRDDVDEAMEKRKASVLTSDRHLKVGPEELSRKWNIGLETAKATLGMTTQHGVRTAVHPMSRRLRVDHLHLHRPRLKGTWYLDTLIANVKLLLGNKCAKVFTNGKYTKVVPITSQKEAVESH